MRDFNTQKPAFSFAQHRTLTTCIALVAFGGVGLAAFAGVGVLRSLFVTTTVNGQVVDERDVTLNDDGSATYTIPLDGDELGGEVTLGIAVAEGDCPPNVGDGDGEVTINLSAEAGDDGEMEITIETTGTDDPDGDDD